MTTAESRAAAEPVSYDKDAVLHALAELVKCRTVSYDDHALEALLDVAEGDDVTYIDFIEIRSAIERLGSEAPVRDFSNDPTYKAVKRLQLK